MGKFETAIKVEILRLARREVKASVTPIKKDVAALKRAVWDINRRLKVVEKSLSKLVRQHKQEARAALLDIPDEVVTKARIGPKLIKALRKRLGITQGELAAILGITTNAIGAWERGTTKPRNKSKTAIVALRSVGRRAVRALLDEG